MNVDTKGIVTLIIVPCVVVLIIMKIGINYIDDQRALREAEQEMMAGIDWEQQEVHPEGGELLFGVADNGDYAPFQVDRQGRLRCAEAWPKAFRECVEEKSGVKLSMEECKNGCGK
jgi:hypothetical protein